MNIQHRQKSHPPCPAWATQLALKREDLTSTEWAALDAHVANCHACRNAQFEYRSLDAALKALPLPIVTPLPRIALALDFPWADTAPSQASDEGIAIPEFAFIRDRLMTPQKRTRVGSLRKKSGQLAPFLVVACILLCMLIVGGLYDAMTHAVRSSGTALRIYRQQQDVISSVAWSPNGRFIATGSWDHTVQVWNAQSGQLITTYSGHEDIVTAIAWSPDGEYLASASWDQTVQVWEAFTGQHITTYRGHQSEVNTVAWSPDGKKIASGGYPSVQIWDPWSGRLLRSYTGPYPDFVNTLAWSPNGQEIASGGSSTSVQIWNAQTGQTRLVYRDYTNSNSIDALSWSPNGKEIAIASRGSSVKLWDATTGNTLLTYSGHTQEVYAIAWSPDGKYLASSSADFTVHVWDAKNGTTTLIYNGHGKNVDALSWSPDSKRIVSGSWDNTAQIWQAIT
jgi:WD40 repeat protein